MDKSDPRLSSMKNPIDIEEFIEKLKLLGQVFELHPGIKISEIVVHKSNDILVLNTNVADSVKTNGTPHVSFDKSQEEIARFIKDQTAIIDEKKRKEIMDQLHKVMKEKEELDLKIKNLQSMAGLSTSATSTSTSEQDSKFYSEVVKDLHV